MTVRIDAAGNLISAGRPHGGFLAVAAPLGLGLILVDLSLSFVAHQVLSWRRATGERRQQLKWLATGAAVTLFVVAVSLRFNSTSVVGEILGIGLAALPIAIGVAILKYRLYDIDRIICRTLGLCDRHRPAGRGIRRAGACWPPRCSSSTARSRWPPSTLAAAALFNPLRRRVQHAVDRRFNRARYDADQTDERRSRPG